LAPRFLMDTHVAIRWLADPKKLSRDQTRVLREAVARLEPVALSTISLLEIAVGSSQQKIRPSAEELFRKLASSPMFQLLPITFEIAAEVAALGDSLRDPADRAIVATARVHHLRLLTSDQRIIESNLVPVIA
jgi:PIN domain nuclease of toxin-antitoxin system